MPPTPIIIKLFGTFFLTNLTIWLDLSNKGFPLNPPLPILETLLLEAVNLSLLIVVLVHMIPSIFKETNKLIRESSTKEGLNLNISDYSEVILEQGMYDRNPGIAAAEGLENVFIAQQVMEDALRKRAPHLC